MPRRVSPNPALFWVTWDGEGVILEGTVLVAADATPADRLRLLRHELTQALGLMRDAGGEAPSVFRSWPETSGAYTALDEAAIRLLYDPRLASGMTRLEILVALDMAGPPRRESFDRTGPAAS